MKYHAEIQLVESYSELKDHYKITQDALRSGPFSDRKDTS